MFIVNNFSPFILAAKRKVEERFKSHPYFYAALGATILGAAVCCWKRSRGSASLSGWAQPLESSSKEQSNFKPVRKYVGLAQTEAAESSYSSMDAQQLLTELERLKATKITGQVSGLGCNQMSRNYQDRKEAIRDRLLILVKSADFDRASLEWKVFFLQRMIYHHQERVVCEILDKFSDRFDGTVLGDLLVRTASCLQLDPVLKILSLPISESIASSDLLKCLCVAQKSNLPRGKENSDVLIVMIEAITESSWFKKCTYDERTVFINQLIKSCQPLSARNTNVAKCLSEKKKRYATWRIL